MGGTASFLPHHSPPHFSMCGTPAVLAQVGCQEQFLPAAAEVVLNIIFLFHMVSPLLVPFHNRLSCNESTLERNQHWIKIKTLIIHCAPAYIHWKGFERNVCSPHIQQRLCDFALRGLSVRWEHTRTQRCFSRKPSAKGFWCLWDARCLACKCFQ